MNKLFQIRRDYTADELPFNHLKTNPIDQFELWYSNAAKKERFEPNAMALATASKSGKPSVRYVLLKAYDNTGFIFLPTMKAVKPFI